MTDDGAARFLVLPPELPDPREGMGAACWIVALVAAALVALAWAVLRGIA